MSTITCNTGQLVLASKSSTTTTSSSTTAAPALSAASAVSVPAVTTANTMTIESALRKKKKSHLSRDELARVCQTGDVTFESYNGSSYMIAVRSQEERKSLIGYRCDWNGCGYMNARVERMFGHIRSQHPEAPVVKKLVTTGSGSSVTSTTSTSVAGSSTDCCSTTESTPKSKSTRLSLRSSSSLSTASSSVTSPQTISTTAASSHAHNHHPSSSNKLSTTPPPSLPLLNVSSIASPTCTVSPSTIASTPTITTTTVSNCPNNNNNVVDDNNNSNNNSSANAKQLFQQRLLHRKFSNSSTTTQTPTATNKCSTTTTVSPINRNSCSRLVNLLQQRRRNSTENHGGVVANSTINNKSQQSTSSCEMSSIKQEVVDDDDNESNDKKLVLPIEADVLRVKSEFKCEDQGVAKSTLTEIPLVSSVLEESPENIMKQLKTITAGSCGSSCLNSECCNECSHPVPRLVPLPPPTTTTTHLPLQPNSHLQHHLQQKTPTDHLASATAVSPSSDPSSTELEMLDMEIESLLQLNNNNSASSINPSNSIAATPSTVNNINSQPLKPMVGLTTQPPLPTPAPDVAVNNILSPIGAEPPSNYPLPCPNSHYTNSQSFVVESQLPNHNIVGVANGLLQHHQPPPSPVLPPNQHPHHPQHHPAYSHSQHHLPLVPDHHNHHHQQQQPPQYYSPHPQQQQQQYGMAPQSVNMISNSSLFHQQQHHLPVQHHNHHDHHQEQSNDDSIIFSKNSNCNSKPASAPPSGANGSRKRSCSSKNYIGKQNLFQEFQSEDVNKIRDTENKYIIALQKDNKIVGYRCDWPECEFLTCRKYVMVNHINGKHTNQRPFSCPLCNFNFVKRYFLKAHMHKVHKRRDDPACNGSVKGVEEVEDDDDPIDSHEEDSQKSANSSHHGLNGSRLNNKNKNSFASSLTDEGSNFDDEMMLLKIENDETFGTTTTTTTNDDSIEFGSNLKKRLKTEGDYVEDHHLTQHHLHNPSSMTYYGGPGGTTSTTTVQSGFVPNSGSYHHYDPASLGYPPNGSNFSDPSQMILSHQHHHPHHHPHQDPIGIMYDEGSQSSSSDHPHSHPHHHLNLLMPNSGIQQQLRNTATIPGRNFAPGGYIDHSQLQHQPPQQPYNNNPHHYRNSFGPRPNYPVQGGPNCPIELLTPPLTQSGTICGHQSAPSFVTNELATGYSANYQTVSNSQTRQTIADDQMSLFGVNSVNDGNNYAGFMVNEEFLSPPSSISSISNGSSATSNNNNNGNGNSLVPGSTTLGPLMNCRNGPSVGSLGPSSTPTSLANSSSFYLHTPSPSPSSLSHSPAAGGASAAANASNTTTTATATSNAYQTPTSGVNQNQYKTNFSNSFDLGATATPTVKSLSSPSDVGQQQFNGNNQNWFSPNGTNVPNPQGYHQPAQTNLDQSSSPQQHFISYSINPNYYTNTPTTDPTYLAQGPNDSSVNMGGMLDVIPLMDYDYDMSMDDNLSTNLATSLIGGNGNGSGGSLAKSTVSNYGSGTTPTTVLPNQTNNVASAAAAGSPNLYHSNHSLLGGNNAATAAVLEDCWNSW